MAKVTVYIVYFLNDDTPTLAGMPKSAFIEVEEPVVGAFSSVKFSAKTHTVIVVSIVESESSTVLIMAS